MSLSDKLVLVWFVTYNEEIFNPLMSLALKDNDISFQEINMQNHSMETYDWNGTRISDSKFVSKCSTF